MPGIPYLAILAAMAAGVLSGFITALLQTKMGIDSLLAGIIVNTGLYSINIAVMGGSSPEHEQTETVFTKARALLQGTVLSEQYKLLVAVIAVIAVVAFFWPCFCAPACLAIRATGDNPDMVRSLYQSHLYHHRGPVRGQRLHGSVRRFCWPKVKNPSALTSAPAW